MYNSCFCTPLRLCTCAKCARKYSATSSYLFSRSPYEVMLWRRSMSNSNTDTQNYGLNALFFDHDTRLQLLFQEVNLVATAKLPRPACIQGTPTLFSIRTMLAFFNNLFEQTEVKICRESSMRFVRGSSSRYYSEGLR